MLSKHIYRGILIFIVLLVNTYLQAQTITTFAGNGTSGYSGDGFPAKDAELNGPQGVAVDLTRNLLYIADLGNAVIRQVDLATNIITTVAGNGTRGNSGDGGPPTAAQLSTPMGVTVDSARNLLYISDTFFNNNIRKVDFGANVITTVAGTGTAGYSGDGGPPADAQLSSPTGVFINSFDNILYIADSENNVIRLVDFAGNIITTIAGNGTPGYSGDGGPAVDAKLFLSQMPFPLVLSGVATDIGDNFLYIADSMNSVVRIVNLNTGIIATLKPSRRNLLGPAGLILDPTGKFLYIADSSHNKIKRIDFSQNKITTVAGNGKQGYSGDGGPATAAELNLPQAVAFDSLGNLYISDSNNNRIRKVSAPTVTSLSPNTGHVSGGTIVNIAGSGFTEVTQVFFGETSALSFTVNSEGSITAVSPPGTGAVSVRVVTSFTTSVDTPGSQFFYALVPLPTISSISPNTGPSTGGTVVTITGNQFINVAQVLFGQTPAASFTVNSQNSITAVSPPGTGTVDVRIVISDIMSPVTPADQFTYSQPSPPEHLKGRQVKNRFATQTDIVNIITWRAPSSGEAPIAYKIYRDAALTELIQTVRADDRHRFKFKDHNRREHKTYTYFIVSIDATGNQSVAARVTVERH